ncbi:hypothetical protein HDV57DRAFT_502321 [Trichoderma longibrachiatum]
MTKEASHPRSSPRISLEGVRLVWRLFLFCWALAALLNFLPNRSTCSRSTHFRTLEPASDKRVITRPKPNTVGSNKDPVELNKQSATCVKVCLFFL